MYVNQLLVPQRFIKADRLLLPYSLVIGKLASSPIESTPPHFPPKYVIILSLTFFKWIALTKFYSYIS